MAFAAVTILMDTLHQHFLQPTPRRNRAKVKLLYKNLSSLQTCLEQDFKVGESDGAIKALEARIRDVSVELRFQIEHHLTLFYLGKSMKLRLHSAQKLLAIKDAIGIKGIEETMDLGKAMKLRLVSAKELLAIKDAMGIKGIEETTDFDSVLEILVKHFTLPVSRMPSHIKKRVLSFWDELDINNGMRYTLWEAESIIRQELRASNYLNKYMKQRIQARHKIRQIFMQGIKLTSYLNKKLLKVKNAYYKQSKTSQDNNTSSLRGPELENITIGDSMSTIKMVGCEDEFNMIMDNLNQPSKEQKLVSIVGMGGIGKTTLSRRIFGDDSFISRFDCQAWVTISQEYNKTKVFNALLCSLAPTGFYENNELDEQVYKCLKGRRYLIVIDDIWSADVMDDLMRCFPDDNNGSRVLLTTRHKKVVADYVGSGSSLCHTKHGLDPNESWNLFHNKVLPERITLSPEFEGIAKEIVKKCKGLPLAITVVAGLLSHSKQDLDEWEQIAKSIPALSLDHSHQQCENIIDLSYTFLPHHLKHCFLSIGSFLEDSEAPGDNIVDFWVSEGFLKVLRSKSLEDVAREYLQDLVDRNLLSFREKNCGLSKVYQMHDVLRELALREIQKENLFCFNNNGFRFGFGFRRTQPINSSSCSISQPCSHTCNTLLALDLSKFRLHFHNMFLRGLIVGNADDANGTAYMFTELMGLVHLRWLVTGCIFKLHSLPLFMLWNLQKLEVSVDLIDEPLNIWRLPQLKNLTIKKVITLVPPRSAHHNLESIGYLDHRSCTKELFVRVPNLRTLTVVEGGTVNPKYKASKWFESLAYLYKMEDLQVRGQLLHPKFSNICSRRTLSIEKFLPNLKKLKLWNTELNWKDMLFVGMLSKLEVLIISKNGVVGSKWEPRDEGFH